MSTRHGEIAVTYPMRFHAWQAVRHVASGGYYLVVLTPDKNLLEGTSQPAYGYMMRDGRLCQRAQAEMEDGRFVACSSTELRKALALDWRNTGADLLFSMVAAGSDEQEVLRMYAEMIFGIKIALPENAAQLAPPDDSPVISVDAQFPSAQHYIVTRNAAGVTQVTRYGAGGAGSGGIGSGAIGMGGRAEQSDFAIGPDGGLGRMGGGGSHPIGSVTQVVRIGAGVNIPTTTMPSNLEEKDDDVH